jgi:hypothetical protein
MRSQLEDRSIPWGTPVYEYAPALVARRFFPDVREAETAVEVEHAVALAGACEGEGAAHAAIARVGIRRDGREPVERAAQDDGEHARVTPLGARQSGHVSKPIGSNVLLRR